MAQAQSTTPSNKNVAANKAPAAVVAKVPKAAPLVGNVIHADLTKYVKGVAQTAGGNKTIDCNDELAAMLRGLPIDQVYARAAKATGMPEGELRAKYSKLNVGMQRMNLGNKIRGAITAANKPAKAPKPVKEAAPKAAAPVKPTKPAATPKPAPKKDAKPAKPAAKK